MFAHFQNNIKRNTLQRKIIQKKMLEKNNFYLNDKKSIHHQNNQQKVTGIVVNEKINTHSDYPK